MEVEIGGSMEASVEGELLTLRSGLWGWGVDKNRVDKNRGIKKEGAFAPPSLEPFGVPIFLKF